MFRAGQQIGHYTLVQKLGKGGFGEVWLAERRSEFVTTLFALKFPLSEQIDLEAVKHEAQLWAQANGHPNVLPIIEASIYDGQVAIISEFAPDGSLEQLLKEKPELPQAEAVELAIGILRGLEFLHSRNIIHRDIKPANVLLQGDTPRLTDFGISRVIKGTSLSITIAGTPKYMAPEAFDGKRNVQTDIWSVGVILYLMLKGNLPFPQEETTELLGAIVFKEPEPLPEAVPPSLQKIVKKALAKKPAERYQTAREMRDDLQKALVGINHPTFAPTEILHKPFIEQTETSTNQTDAPTVQTNAPSIQTEIQPEQTEKETEQFTRPAIETKPSSDAPSIVTQINPSQTYESVKPLPTVAQAFAANKTASRKNNPALYYVGVGIVGLILLVGLIAVVVSNRFNLSQITNTSNPANTTKQTNTTNASNSTTTIAENVQLVPFRKGDKFGFSDVNKKLLIEAKYDEARPFYDGLAIIKRDGKYGFIDRSGKEVIPPKYDYLGRFYKVGLAYASIGSYPNSKCGYIDRNGSEVIPITNKWCGNFSEDLASLKINENDKEGYINKTGEFVIQPKFIWGKSFSDGLAAVNLDGKHGFIDKTGKIVIQPKYDYAEPFSEGLAEVNFGFKNIIDGTGKWGFIDKTGKIVIPIKYDSATSFSEGLVAVEADDKYGFIDKTGNTVIPFKYGHVNQFSEGLAYARFTEVQDGYYKYGFIDKTDKVVIPFKYQTAESFENGFAKVKFNNKEFYIDKNGTEYYEP